MISLYCVGIHFCQMLDFYPDLPAYQKQPDGSYAPGGPNVFMSGRAIMEQAAEKFGLRYKLADSAIYPQPDHIQYLSYTPTPQQDPKPRVTLGSNIFPFYGQALSLIEHLAPIGEISTVLQYTVQWPKGAAGPFPTPTPVTLNNTGRPDANFPAPTAVQKSDAAFGSNGFPDNCEIRVRLLSIYCTS